MSVSNRPQSQSVPWEVVGLTLLAAALAFQPIANDGLWWDLSRGRAVWDGAFFPSHGLLAGDGLSEADWLGGLPWFVFYQFGGPHSLMAIRLIGVAAVFACGWRMLKDAGFAGLQSVAAVFALIVVTPGLDPGALWWDVLGVGICVWLSRRPMQGAGRWITLFLLTTLWANCGPRCLLVLPMLLLPHLVAPDPTNAGRRSSDGPRATKNGVPERSTRPLFRRAEWLLPPALIVIALCLTPRGLFGLRDSLLILCPGFAGPSAGSFGGSWLFGHSIGGGSLDPWGVVSWIGLSFVAALSIFQEEELRRNRLLAWGIVQCAALSNPASLPPLAVWLWGIHVAALSASSLRGDLARLRSRRRLAIIPMVIAGMVVSGPWPGSERRIGWGISPRLEPRQLAAIFDQSNGNGATFAFDERAAGIAAWVAPHGPRPWLTPQRALLQGALHDETLRLCELRSGWDLQHRTVAGQWGGWWVPLMKRQTSLLLVPAEETRLIARLEPTVWKPLLLDAPVIPFAIAGDERFARDMVEVLLQRDFVERGAWSYAAPSAAGTDWSVDLWGWLTGRPDRRPIERQIRLFLAFRLPIAALKLIHAVRHAGLGNCKAELIDATLQLAEEGRLHRGAPDPLRMAILSQLGAAPVPESELARHMAEAPAAQRDATRARQLAGMYLSAGPGEALKFPFDESPSEQFTKAELLLELGDPAGARRILESVASTSADGRWRVIAEDGMDRLAGAEQR